MRILAVDDDPDFLAVFQTVLRNLGYDDVTLASSGQYALQLITEQHEPFDCFILDIQMPGMDGIELCAQIRTLPRYRDTPITMNTVISDRGHIDRAFLAGATDYLTKPVDEVEIRTRLGVIKTLVAARKQAKNLAPSDASAQAGPTVYGFMDNVPMKRIDGAVDQMAMCNYIKALGFFRARNTGLVAVQVTNARQIFDMEGGSVFGDIIVDVATCLADSLNASPRLITYLGGGTFVCLLPRNEALMAEAMAQKVRRFIAEFETVYSDLDITLPDVAVGSPVLCSQAHVRTPSRAMDEAVSVFRASGTPLGMLA